jgi:hippurate hydrolase
VTLDGVQSRFSPELRAKLVTLRREIHQEPELALQEFATAARLARALAELGITEVRRVGTTGLVARVPGQRHDSPSVALRGDIDALPIDEATGLPYASRRAGIMHACGHDVHATWAVGAAALLTQEPACGDVLVILQPAEEIGRGALSILESGALDEVRAIFGGHVDRRFELGQVVADEGPLAASADTFEIELIGAGAHAARPHEARDPIVALAAVVTALQTIVARRLNPATPGVVTVGMVQGGTAPNIIPDRARASGTVRAVEPRSRQKMLREVERIARSIAAAHDVEARVAVERGTPPIVNPALPAAWARRAAAAVVGQEHVVPLGALNLAAEDFAHYMERIPGCFMRIGAREVGGPIIPGHSATFYPAEDTIFVGAAVLAECARVASSELAAGR